MLRIGVWVVLIGAGLGLAACGRATGPAASGISSSAPNAVESAASGETGGGANKFTPAQVTPGSPAASP
jgi:hypothetical protein